jgi:hypothetical protein
MQLQAEATTRDTALANLDYMFGCNAMGMSWTTGIGFTYPAVLQHEVEFTLAENVHQRVDDCTNA